MAQRRAKEFRLTNKYNKLFRKIKKKFPTMLQHVNLDRVAVVSVQARKMAYLGKIYGNRVPWSTLIKGFDYIVCIWSTRFDTRKRSVRWYVVFHELYHIPETGFLKGSPSYRKCRKHDIEDFQLLRGFYGMHMENSDRIFEGEKALLKETKKKEDDD